MNPDLRRLQPYPFERLRQLFAGTNPPSDLAPINLSIGEPKHATPRLIFEALTAALPGLAQYPVTAGMPALREAIASWLTRRFDLPAIDPGSQVLPVIGTREALFAIAQTVIDRTRSARVVAPNPFYQIYEGAALLAGADPVFLPTTAEGGFRMAFETLTPGDWDGVQLVYVCSPGNPTGTVVSRAQWARLFELSARHGFVIASDECYSEIYPDEAAPPEGALAAAHALGLHGFDRLLVFSSLSKRSSVPGLRSGFVAGDAALIARFLLLRSYNGGAMSATVQAASVAAWTDEAHVVENRRLYREKFDAVLPRLDGALRVRRPEGGFFLWAGVPGGDDAAFARDLLAQYNVLALPGSFLARDASGRNPGAGFVRLALVDGLAACVEAAERIRAFATPFASRQAPRPSHTR